MGKLTYLDKVALNENPDIPDINKVKASDMNEIKNVVNGLVKTEQTTTDEETYSCNYINNLVDYSTNETRVGTWKDGKPLYRKVIEINNLNASPYDIDISSLNAEWLEIENSQFEYVLNNILYSWVGSVYNNTDDNIRIFRRGEVVRIVYGSSQSAGTNKKVTLIIKYTKTTD